MNILKIIKEYIKGPIGKLGIPTRIELNIDDELIVGLLLDTGNDTWLKVNTAVIIENGSHIIIQGSATSEYIPPIMETIDLKDPNSLNKILELLTSNLIKWHNYMESNLDSVAWMGGS